MNRASDEASMLSFRHILRNNMKRTSALAALLVAGLWAFAGSADEAKPLFVYVSPNAVGVNDFLKLGNVGTERVANELGGQAKTLRKHRSYDAPPELGGCG